MGSGKDTVGKIIDFLIEFETIKNKYDTNSTILNEYNDWLEVGGLDINNRWQIKKFAGKLKQIASILTGISIEKFEDQEFKMTNLGEEWRLWKTRNSNLQEVVFSNKDACDRYADYYADITREVNITIRELLQKVGTEAMRNNLHPNVWVNALFADWKPQKMSERNPSRWIITDLRFPNEYQAIKDRGGICVRVNRHFETQTFYNSNISFPDGIPVHPSENELDDYAFDYVIENNGSLEELIEEVKKMLQHFKIIE
jgi:hypothetical protein